ncbi:AlkA N-terminal domain-containing protein [Vibrio gangliei]|uniref:AlkA N-terminal domain-containing protein n=1 Tax=Vibrio gangliei TaxID=2077090 RepID=UPI0013003E67|nr:AlkA N-terminal domain-containing protein [Vibrio gangliei]
MNKPSSPNVKCDLANELSYLHSLTCPDGFDYEFMLSFLAPRMIDGVENVINQKYLRSFYFPLSEPSNQFVKGYFSVQYQAPSHQLDIEIHCDDSQAIEPVLQRIAFMFDLDTDMTAIEQHLQHDEILQRGFIHQRVPRMPKAFDSFEFCIRAILGQQVSVKAATTLAKRIAHASALATPAHFPEGIDYYFPQCQDLSHLNFSGLGLTQSRIATLQLAIASLQSGEVSLSKAQNFEEFLAEWTHLKGVGPWTANYLAMRGLGIQDSFPDKDLGVLKALADKDGKYPSRKAVLEQAKAWQPYRAYATLCLWNGLGH